jgi:hypothetical protein
VSWFLSAAKIGINIQTMLDGFAFRCLDKVRHLFFEFYNPTTVASAQRSPSIAADTIPPA